jgi:hypothetical protein
MRFQNLSRDEYFEGWYFKQVSHDEKTIICFIPGVSVHNGNSSPFIQAILTQNSGGCLAANHRLAGCFRAPGTG